MGELDFLEEWIPEQMEPGTMFLLKRPTDVGGRGNPYWAVLACPQCGCLGLITKHQYVGLEAMICGSDTCSSAYFLGKEAIRYRKPS